MPTNARTPAAILEHQTAAWNAADTDAILQDFAPDAVLTSASGQTLSGIPAIRQSLTSFFSAFAQIRLTLRSLVAQDDTAGLRVGILCRHRLTGNSARLPASVFITCKNGKITHWREYYDTAQFKTQIATAISDSHLDTL